MIVLETLLLGAAMVLALYFFGFGVTRLLLPRELNAHARLLIPFFGMAMVIVWDYIALWLGFNLTEATWGLVVVAVALVIVTQVRREKSHAVRNDNPRERAYARETLWVLALALLAFCAAVVPLWRYGFVTVIGENWDYEFYLPLADYLREFTTAQLVNAPANPLLSTILSRHILPLPMGFSYLHATLNELLRMQALDTFPTLLGVLRALGVSGAFLFFRAAFKMSERAALIATALVAVNGLLLWFTYWSFGLHLAALALLPVGLLLGVQALQGAQNLRERDWRSLVSAGLLLGALNVTYHPALIVAGLSLGAFGLWLLITERERINVIVNGAAVAALTIAFSFPTLGHIDDFVREYYGRTPLAIGLREYVPFADGYGFSNQTLELVVGQTISTPQLFALAQSVWGWSGTILTLTAVVFSAFALWQLRKDSERRGVWYAMVAAAVIYVLVSRLPFLRPYPYGFLKSLSLVSYVLIALTVQGIAFAWAQAGRQETGDSPEDGLRRRRIIRYGAAAMLVLCGAVSLFTFGITVEQYFKPSPMFFNADALRLRELDALLATQAVGHTSRPNVFLTDRLEVQGIPMGLAAYALRQQELYGNVSTGYAGLENAVPSVVYDFALLARGEDPGGLGYQPTALWENEKFALYPRESGVLAQQIVNQTLSDTMPLDMIVEVEGAGSALSQTSAEGALSVVVDTFEPQSVLLQAGLTEQRVSLERGVTRITFPYVSLPTTLRIEPQTDQKVFVHYWQLREANKGAVEVTPLDTMLVQCLGNTDDLGAQCRVVNPQARALTWKWVVRGTRAGSREDQELIVADADGTPRERVRIHATDDGALQEIQFDEDVPIAAARPKLPDGKWRADVELWDGETLMARMPVFSLIEVAGGTQVRVERDETLPPVILAP